MDIRKWIYEKTGICLHDWEVIRHGTLEHYYVMGWFPDDKVCVICGKCVDQIRAADRMVDNAHDNRERRIVWANKLWEDNNCGK